MAISQTKYINIVSGVGGAASASRRLLIARLMTTNVKAPTNTILEMNLAGVLAQFGSTSAEYAFAVKYFGFVSKSITQASLISVARYTPSAVAPVLESTFTADLDALKALTAGTFTITLGAETETLTLATMAGISDLAGAAAILETAIKGNTSGGAVWTGATVTATNGVFKITGGATGAASTISYATGTAGIAFGFDVGNAPFISVGADAETVVEAMTRVDGVSNNFGSFKFMETLSDTDIGLVASWNDALNYKYLYSVSCPVADIADLRAQLTGKTGSVLTLDTHAAQADFMPMALLAATDYTRPNAVKNFMYQKFDDELPSVTADTGTFGATAMDAIQVNYLGTTQQAGKIIQFYQDGIMQDGGDLGPFCNEMWLKDAISTEFMNLLLALEMIPANDTGANIAATTIQSILTEALHNGTISVGKTLTNTQKAYITQVSADVDAWREVEQNGYWLGVTIVAYTENSVNKYRVDYVLIYSKGDSIRKVTGSDILI